ncbi:MAG TPA: GNAT family protein [Mycobacteriales bacterium]|jgi:RimJ/RimL family protein N-acetyltransferase|nr:GNAT family protein [Mycobacteriales bacterium]
MSAAATDHTGCCPGVTLWPPAGLRVTASARGIPLVLRAVRDEDLPGLVTIFPPDVPHDPALAVGGDPAQVQAQAVLRHVWRARAELAPQNWRLTFAVEAAGELAGQQDLKAADFPERRIVETSSWLGEEFRGRGIAKAMRAMALQLAFTCFDAVAAEADSVEGNDAALGVSRSLGYSPCGDTYELHQGRVEHVLWTRLTRDRWALLRQGYGLSDVEITGARECRPLLGLGDADC